MTFLHRALAALQQHFHSDRETDEAYLAGSVDIYDLERRMRQLETRNAQPPFHLRHSA